MHHIDNINVQLLNTEVNVPNAEMIPISTSGGDSSIINDNMPYICKTVVRENRST